MSGYTVFLGPFAGIMVTDVRSFFVMPLGVCSDVGTVLVTSPR